MGIVMTQEAKIRRMTFRSIAPNHGNNIFRKIRYQFRMMHDDIAPELHCNSPLLTQLIDFHQELEINLANTTFFDGCFTFPFTKGPGLIAPYIELAAAKVR